MGLTRPAHIAVLALLLTSMVIASPNRADAAPGCSSGAEIRRGGGSAQGCKTKETPDGPQDTSGPGASQEALWNQYCLRAGPYGPGKTAVISNGRPVTAEEVQRLNVPADYLVYQITCRPQLLTFFLPFAPGTAPAVDPTVLRDEARARIEPPLPVVGLSPPGDSDIIGIVKIPVWFWSEGSWDPITETESQGAVTVTVTATPGSLTFNPGDGNPPGACVGPGRVWAPGMELTPTDCSYTYKSSSADQPNQVYNASVVANWVFTWTLNGTDQGEFGEVDTTEEFTYAVGEIQAIEK